MSKMLKIDQIHLRAVMLCMSKMGKEHTDTFLTFECNAIYVEDVKDRSNIPKGCNAMYVRDVEHVKDRSNTPKGCSAMYVKDVEDGKRTYTHILAHNFLNTKWIFNQKKVSESWDLGLSNHTIKHCVY